MIDERKFDPKVILALILLIAFSGILTIPVNAQANIDPDGDSAPVREVLQKFSDFSATGENDTIRKADILTGEISDLKFKGPMQVSTTGKIILLLDGRAVAHVSLGPDKTDYYLFLALEQARWKIESVRALALPKFVFDLREQLQKLQQRSNEQEAMFQNLNLTMSSDADLLKWFADNKAALNRLRALNPVFSHFDETDNSSTRVSNIPEANEIVERLYLNYAEQKDDGRFDVSIGGILDNSVGYFHAELEEVPKIGSSEYIWIEPLGDGWYFYKTT